MYAAALAFETAFNRIMYLASRHAIPSDEYDRKFSTGLVSVCRATYTKNARVSYCDGLANGLLKRVRETTAKPSPSMVPEETECDVTVTPEEETRLACVTKKVEESVLAKNNISFSKHKRRGYKTSKVTESYLKGEHDSSCIDLKQRSLQ